MELEKRAKFAPFQAAAAVFVQFVTLGLYSAFVRIFLRTHLENVSSWKLAKKPIQFPLFIIWQESKKVLVDLWLFLDLLFLLTSISEGSIVAAAPKKCLILYLSIVVALKEAGLLYFPRHQRGWRRYESISVLAVTFSAFLSAAHWTWKRKRRSEDNCASLECESFSFYPRIYCTPRPTGLENNVKSVGLWSLDNLWMMQPDFDCLPGELWWIST